MTLQKRTISFSLAVLLIASFFNSMPVAFASHEECEAKKKQDLDKIKNKIEQKQDELKQKQEEFREKNKEIRQLRFDVFATGLAWFTASSGNVDELKSVWELKKSELRQAKQQKEQLQQELTLIENQIQKLENQFIQIQNRICEHKCESQSNEAIAAKRSILKTSSSSSDSDSDCKSPGKDPVVLENGHT